MKEENEIEQGFYQRCAELLGVQTTYRKFPFRKRTRWNNRTAGNGRFEGRGTVRLFGNSVHISLRNPAINKWFGSPEAALKFLEELELPPL